MSFSVGKVTGTVALRRGAPPSFGLDVSPEAIAGTGDVYRTRDGNKMPVLPPPSRRAPLLMSCGLTNARRKRGSQS